MRTLRNLRNNTIYEGKEDLLKVEKMKYYTSPDWKDKALDTVVIDNDGKSENVKCKDITKNIESFIRAKSSTIMLMADSYTLRVKKSEINKLAVSPYNNISAEMINPDGSTSEVSLHMLKESKNNINNIFERDDDKSAGKALAVGLMGCFTSFVSNKDADLFSLMVGVLGVLAVGAGTEAVKGAKNLKDKIFNNGDEDTLDNARAAALTSLEGNKNKEGEKNDNDIDEDVLSMFVNPDSTPKSVDDIKKEVGDIPQDQLDDIKKKVDAFASDPENAKMLAERGEWVSKLSSDDKKLLDDKAKATMGVMTAQKKKDASDKTIKEMEDELKKLKDANDPDQEDYMKTLENNINTKKEEQKKIDEELESAKKTLSETSEKVNSSEALKSKPSLKKPNIPKSMDPNGEPNKEPEKGGKGENGEPDPDDDDKPSDDEEGDEEKEEEEVDPDTGEKIKVSVQTKTGKRGGKYFRTKRKGADRWSEWQNGHYGEN